jgi:hypothetical protein
MDEAEKRRIAVSFFGQINRRRSPVHPSACLPDHLFSAFVLLYLCEENVILLHLFQIKGG